MRALVVTKYWDGSTEIFINSTLGSLWVMLLLSENAGDDWAGGCWGGGCNWVPLLIVFVLLYSVCHSVSVLFCVDVIQSVTYVFHVIWNVTERRGETVWEKSERQYQWPLIFTIKKERRNKIRNLCLWLVCCSLLPTCYFHQLFTISIQRNCKYVLHNSLKQ